MHQSNTSHAWTIHGYNLEQLLVFKALWVGWRVHQSTSWTPLLRGQSMYAIQNSSLFLGLYELVDECTCPPVEHLPRMDDPCMQSQTTPCFQGSSELIVKTLPSSHTWTIHVCNPEQLLVFRALSSRSTRLFRIPTHGRSMYAIRSNSLFLGLLRVGRQNSSKSPRKKKMLEGTYTYIYIYGRSRHDGYLNKKLGIFALPNFQNVNYTTTLFFSYWFHHNL